MNITKSQLKQQFERAKSLGWLPYFKEAAKTTKNHFDEADLMAIGSRETNLDPKWLTKAGDKGNGFGLLQIDRRSFPEFTKTDKWKDASGGILKGAQVLMQKWHDFEQNIGKSLSVRSSKGMTYRYIAKAATGSLAQKIAISSFNCGRWSQFAHSCGQDIDSYSTGHDYAADVMARAAVFRDLLKSSLSTNSETENSREFNTHTPLNEVVEKSGDGRGLSDELNEAENPAAPPAQQAQTADQITNISSGSKTVPDDFTPETKVMDAPAASGVTAKLGKWTAYLGLGVPSLAGIGQAVKSLYADGTISPAEIFTVISSVFKYVLPYSVYIIFGIIGYKIVKTAFVQASFMLRMFLNASADKHDVEIAVKKEDALKR
jgi:hypothetical protein